jgi:bud site selection protein 31
MPKIKTSRVKYPEGWELIEPTLRDLEAKMREAENDPHDGKRKCEALWPIFRISHQKSRYIYDLYYRRKEISKELYEFCLDQGYADRHLIAKWTKRGYARLSASAAYKHEATTLQPPASAGSPSISGRRK